MLLVSFQIPLTNKKGSIRNENTDEYKQIKCTGKLRKKH